MKNIPTIKNMKVTIPTNMLINTEYTLKATVEFAGNVPSNITDFTWTISDDTLGTLNGNKLTPLQEGTIQITATYKNDTTKFKKVYVKIVSSLNIAPVISPSSSASTSASATPSPTATPTINTQIPIESELKDMKLVGNYLYVSDKTNNKIVIADTTNNTIYKEINVGSAPYKFDITGTKLYVACSGASSVDVIDLTTYTKTDSISVDGSPYDVTVNANRMFVSFYQAGWSKQVEIYALDTKTKVGMIDNNVIGSASLELSPDRNTLFAAQEGGSPAYFWKCDASNDTGTLLRETQHGSIGSNLRDFALSPDASRAYLACGSPYYIQVINTDTFASVGQLDTGPYPIGIAISSDGTKAVASNDSIEAYIFNTTTFTQFGAALKFGKTISKLATNGTKVYGFMESVTSYDKVNVVGVTTF